MRIIVIGQNEQGWLYQNILGPRCVGCLNTLQDMPLQSYDAVYISTANDHKATIASQALSNKKHVFLVAPLWGNSITQLDELEYIARKNKVVLYVGHKYRFIKEFAAIQSVILANSLGRVQHCRLAFVATADNKYDGALIDLNAHLLDLLDFWFGTKIMQNNFNLVYKDPYGRQAIIADYYSDVSIELAANFYGRENSLQVEIFGLEDSIQLIYHFDMLETEMRKECMYFDTICSHAANEFDCTFDRWIYAELDRLVSEQLIFA